MRPADMAIWFPSWSGRTVGWNKGSGTQSAVSFENYRLAMGRINGEYVTLLSWGTRRHARFPAFPHLIYHFVLTYSNWESSSICYSESFERRDPGAAGEAR